MAYNDRNNGETNIQMTNLFRLMEWKKDFQKSKMLRVDLFNDFGVLVKLHTPSTERRGFNKSADVSVPIRFEEMVQLESMLRTVAVDGLIALEANEDDFRVTVDQEFTKNKKKLSISFGRKDGKPYIVIGLEADGNKGLTYLSTARLHSVNGKSFGLVGVKRLLELADIVTACMDHSSIRLENHFKRFFDNNRSPEDVAKTYNKGDSPKGTDGADEDEDDFPF